MEPKPQKTTEPFIKCYMAYCSTKISKELHWCETKMVYYKAGNWEWRQMFKWVDYDK